MKFEYKRVIISLSQTAIKYDERGKLKSNVEDSTEELFNSLGSEGWELVSAVNLDSGADGKGAIIVSAMEYLFKRQVFS